MLLDYGMTRSTARVNRRLKQKFAAGGDGASLDHRWFVVYGDPSVSKFFEFDGLWEVEDISEKVIKMVPYTAVMKDLRTGDGETVKFDGSILEMAHGHSLDTLELAKKWGYVGLTALSERRGDFGTAGKSILENSKHHLQDLLARIDGIESKIMHKYDIYIGALQQQ